MRAPIFRALVAAVSVWTFVGLALPARAATVGASSSGCGAAVAAGTSTVWLTSGGMLRSAIVHTPADTQPLPLVLNLHAYTSNASSQEAISGMDSVADQQGFVVAYPQGSLGSNGQAGWNVTIPGNPPTVDDPSALTGVVWTADDQQFLSALVSSVEARYCVDTTRISMTGYSMGGILALAMACAGVGWLSAVEPVAATPPSGTGCAARPVEAFHGEQDTVDLYSGNGGNAPLPAILGCGPAIWSSGDVIEYACASGPLYAVTDGGHTWPGSPQGLWLWLAGLGSTTYTINASALIGQFALSHAR